MLHKRCVDAEPYAAFAKLVAYDWEIGIRFVAAFIVFFFDANVLYPTEIRNLLMHLALGRRFPPEVVCGRAQNASSERRAEARSSRAEALAACTCKHESTQPPTKPLHCASS
jgi:hypothetical protein